MALAQVQADQDKAARPRGHLQAERGNAARVFEGPGFVEREAW